jgi:potassium voltage-gated channel Eag-related subfamily H protein 8
MQKSCACHFLYGPKTDVQHRDAIAKSLENKQELKLEVIFYKSSGK